MVLTETEQAQVASLRDLIGEAIPEGGNAGDTLFSDAKLLTWVKSSATEAHAALKGWQVKMAHFANLVNTTDGAASREMSDLFEHAQQMVRTYTNLAKGPTAGRSRVGRITRS